MLESSSSWVYRSQAIQLTLIFLIWSHFQTRLLPIIFCRLHHCHPKHCQPQIPQLFLSSNLFLVHTLRDQAYLRRWPRGHNQINQWWSKWITSAPKLRKCFVIVDLPEQIPPQIPITTRGVSSMVFFSKLHLIVRFHFVIRWCCRCSYCFCYVAVY